MSKMIEYKRTQFNTLASRLREERKFIQVISGPRQTGKTTLIRQLLEDSEIPSAYITADNSLVDSATWIAKHWEAARINALMRGGEFILAIDEIQKINGWSTIVKGLWDEDTFNKRKVKVILSGSSGLLLSQGLNESLAGRFEITFMPHWSMSEMQNAFGWSTEQYVWFGGYPGSAGIIKDEQRWKKYVREALIETTISKDILLMTRIDKPALLKQLFDLGCAYSGQILSYNKMLGQLQDAGNTVTLAGYLNLLNRSGLLTGLEKYSHGVSRQKLSSPKFMVRNTALLSSAMTETMNEIQNKPEVWGRIVESSIGAYLINSCEDSNFTVWYWREANYEVDFVIRKGETITGIEVKSGSGYRLTGLDKFKKAYPGARVLLVGDGGIRWEEFLSIDLKRIFN